MAGPQFTGGFGTSAFSLAGSGNGIGDGKAATSAAARRRQHLRSEGIEAVGRIGHGGRDRR